MKLKLCVFMCMLIIPVLVIAAEPPSLEHHQFYGRVTWDMDMDVPQTVVASVNGVEYSSLISIVMCDTNPCTGKYGYDEGNYLRVQGDEGDTVAFYVDDSLIDTILYQPWGVTRHDLSISSSPVTCDQRWDCDEWSACVDNTKTQLCMDVNECDSDELTKTEQQVCSVANDTAEQQQVAACVYEWECTVWNSCSNGRQTRTCQQSDDCDTQLSIGTVSSVTQFPRPAETKVCGVITGTAAPSVVPPTREITGTERFEEASQGVSVWYYVGGIVLILLALLVLILFLRSRSKSESGSGNQYPPQY
ncbi:hypothetical protein COV17_04340 [Candidatus Woesearchaeota archaeon CG10_big_fil_rev_8_21_14_0_10_36_11]|nr:MAG: hypothetical protein COV17_04340 [Candidatus Woesearchaeota archaeon CG10_big_fil_rev_8_21_14_0_10_36_11]